MTTAKTAAPLAPAPRPFNPFVHRTWTPPATIPATHRRAGQLLPGDAVSIEGDRLTVAEVDLMPGLVMLAFVGLPDYVLALKRDALVCVLRLGVTPKPAPRATDRQIDTLRRILGEEGKFQMVVVDTSGDMLLHRQGRSPLWIMPDGSTLRSPVAGPRASAA
jgi:hypothetical protein